jgi:hypothetical protein
MRTSLAPPLTTHHVTPAKAGVHPDRCEKNLHASGWIPAFAGMTVGYGGATKG